MLNWNNLTDTMECLRSIGEDSYGARCVRLASTRLATRLQCATGFAAKCRLDTPLTS